jgi:hypothetical protein
MIVPGGTRIRAGLEWVRCDRWIPPDYRLKCLSRGAVFGKLKVLASGTGIVRAKIS